MRCTDCGRDLTRLALVSEHRGWCPRRFAHTPGHAALLQAAWDDGTVMTSDGLMPRRVHIVALAVRDLFAAIRAWCEREAREAERIRAAFHTHAAVGRRPAPPPAPAPAPVAEADARAFAMEWCGNIYSHAPATRVVAGWVFTPSVGGWAPFVADDRDVRAYQARRTA